MAAPPLYLLQRMLTVSGATGSRTVHTSPHGFDTHIHFVALVKGHRRHAQAGRQALLWTSQRLGLSAACMCRAATTGSTSAAGGDGPGEMLRNGWGLA